MKFISFDEIVPVLGSFTTFKNKSSVFQIDLSVKKNIPIDVLTILHTIPCSPTSLYSDIESVLNDHIGSSIIIFESTSNMLITLSDVGITSLFPCKIAEQISTVDSSKIDGLTFVCSDPSTFILTKYEDIKK